MIIVRWSFGPTEFRLVVKPDPKIEVMAKDEAGDTSWTHARIANHDKTVALVLMKALEYVAPKRDGHAFINIGEVQP